MPAASTSPPRPSRRPSPLERIGTTCRPSTTPAAAAVRQALRPQALAVTGKGDGQGRCQVEKEVKTRRGRSPDDLDALNLAYLAYTGLPAPSSVAAPARAEPRPRTSELMQPGPGWDATRRRLYGR